jgi:hypothetical protein
MQKDADRRLYETRDQKVAFATLLELVRSGKNVAIPADSKALAHLVHELLLREGGLAPDEVHCYSADTGDDEKAKHFADVNEHWSHYRVIIYTPTVTAGCSFEREHFDTVFGLFTGASVTVETARQMMRRVRSVRDGCYYVCFHKCSRNDGLRAGLSDMEEALATMVDNIHDSLPFRYSADGRRREFPYKDAYYWTYIWNLRTRRLSERDFAGRFLEQEQHSSGVQLLGWPEVAEAAVLEAKAAGKDAREAAKEREAEAVAQARTLTLTDASELQAKMERSEDEKRSLEKYYLARDYSVPAADITAPFVRAYGDYRTRRVFQLRRRLGEFPSTAEFLAAEREARAAGLNAAQEAADVLAGADGRDLHHFNRLLYNFHFLEAAGLLTADLLRSAGSLRVQAHALHAGLKNKLAALIRAQRATLETIFGKRSSPDGDPADWERAAYLRYLNSTLESTLGIKIVRCDRVSELYGLVDVYEAAFNGPGQPQYDWHLG